MNTMIINAMNKKYRVEVLETFYLKGETWVIHNKPLDKGLSKTLYSISHKETAFNIPISSSSVKSTKSRLGELLERIGDKGLEALIRQVTFYQELSTLEKRKI